MKTIFGEADVISRYTLQQAIEDGMIVEIFKDQWKELSRGKPIVATAHLFHFFDPDIAGLAILLGIWHEFVAWRKHIMPTLPEEEQLFVTTLNDNKIWVIEDGDAFTMMFPEDY